MLAWLAAAGFAVAHPISMSTTTVNVRTDEVLIEMTVMLEGGLDIAPVITHRFGFEEFEKGFETALSGESGKVILEW